jgi:hypothetical protein
MAMTNTAAVYCTDIHIQIMQIQRLPMCVACDLLRPAAPCWHQLAAVCGAQCAVVRSRGEEAVSQRRESRNGPPRPGAAGVNTTPQAGANPGSLVARSAQCPRTTPPGSSLPTPQHRPVGLWAIKTQDGPSWRWPMTGRAAGAPGLAGRPHRRTGGSCLKGERRGERGKQPCLAGDIPCPL